MSQWQPTTCMRCAVGCGLEQNADGEGIRNVRGNTSHPTNSGADCQRGIRETVAPRGRRLTEPLVRRGGELQSTDWDTAIGVVATRFIEALRANTGNVAVFGSGQQTNEAAYALGKVARGAFGTPYYDANTGLCMASAVTAYDRAFGGNAPPPTYDDIPDAETHLVWGANPATAHPVLYNWIADSASDDDSHLIVVDPIESETASKADCHLQPEPGTDLALVRAVLSQLVGTDAVDREFIEAYTTGYEQLVDVLPTVERAAKTAGLSVSAVETLAEAVSEPTMLYWGMGVNQSVQGTATARGLIDLCLATGNLGPGSGPFSLTGQANSMGNRVCAAKETWPGHQPFGDSDVRKAIANEWSVPFSRLPTDRGEGFVKIVDRIARGEIDACWTVATNPAAGMPDASHVKSVLEDVFLVVQDSFYSDTVECADVVLPAATWGETEGTTMNMERRLSRVRAAAKPPQNAKQDLDIIATIGNRIEPELFGEPPLEPQTVFDELRGLTAGSVADFSGISYSRLADELAVRWPAPDADSEGGYQYYTNGEWEFDTDSGLAAFSVGNHGGLAEPLNNSYPLTLTTGRQAGIYNTGVRSHADGDRLPTARVHSETIASRLSAFERGQTMIESRRSAVTAAVETDDGVPPGIVWLPIHHPAVNQLTLPVVDPDSDEPNYKQCAVRLQAPTATEPPAEADPTGESVDT